MEQTNIKPKLTDLLPVFCGLNYVSRTTFSPDEKPSIKDYLTRGVITLGQIAYNSVIGIELINALEGRSSFTVDLVQKIFQ